MRRQTIWFILLLTFWFSGYRSEGLYAQFPENLRFEHITLKEGLSQMAVYFIHQDRTGFLWFATQDGLNRYDGNSLKIFRHDPANPHSPSDNFIREIAEDSDGVLWLGSFGKGVDRFDPTTGKCQHFIHDPKNPHTLSKNSITGIIAAKNGFIWAGTQDSGLNKLDPRSGKVIRYRHDPGDPNSLSNDSVTDVVEDTSGHIWIATQQGLNRLEPETGKFTLFRQNPGQQGGLSNNFIRCLYIDRSGALWAGTVAGDIHRYDPESASFAYSAIKNRDNAPPTPSSIRAIFQDNRGMFWIGTEGGGLILFDPVREKVKVIKSQPMNPRSLSADFILSILEDRSGLIWLGSQGGGVNKYNPRIESFRILHQQPNNPASLSSDMVYSIYAEAPSLVWLGGRKGLNRHDWLTGQTKHFLWDPKNPSSISHDRVYCISRDVNGTLWVGTDVGLDKMNSDGESFEHFPKKHSSSHIFMNGSLNSILPDKYGRLWLSTSQNGFILFDPKKETFRVYRHEPNNPNSINSNYIFTAIGDPDEDFWIGSSEGVCRFSLLKNTFTRYVFDPTSPNSLGSNKIMSLHSNSEGIIWIGTLGGGLNRLDPDTGAIRRYSESDGLTNQTIYGILEDENHYLWLSSNLGLFRFDPRTHVFIHYDESDGLPGNEFNNGSCFKGLDGRLYFGGINGMVTFLPKDLKPNEYIPPVVITDFEKFNKPAPLAKSIFSLSELNLSYKDNVFSFAFASLDFTAPAKNRYAYKMEGFDRDWMYAKATKPFATYTNLSPGSYVFKVKASNSSGSWNEKGAAISIRIFPPWWSTTLFKLSALLAFILIIFSLYRLRMRAIKKQKQKLEEIISERTEDLKYKTNELEKINNIVKAINSEIDLPDLLNTVMRETFDIKTAPDALALVHDDEAGLYRSEACANTKETDCRNTVFTEIHIGEKFLTGAVSPIPDVFLVKGEEHVRLILRIPGREHPAGYLIFNTLPEKTVYDPRRLALLAMLKDHIVSAFMRSKLLLELRTANLRAEKERLAAEAASRSKSDFLARMSHEIRTPMSSVIGFTDILMDTDLSDEQMDYARTINRSGESLLSLINDILDFSRVESGQLTLEAIDFDPEVMAFDVCELMRPRIGPKPVEIICRIGEHVPSNVKGDPGRYRQVLINLMGNAVKFTDSGEIELSIDVDSEDNDSISLHAIVKDTGVGIPPEKKQSIFECFQQAEDSTTREYGGSGLGLAICKQISRLMKGDVWVESQLKRGSAFHFTALLEKSGKRPIKPSTPESLTGKKVLVVDDNKNNLDILTHLLTSAGMEVVTLTRGSDVIPMLLIGQKTRSPFHLCILDIQIPDVSGYEIARRIRASDSPSPDMPLLAFTSSYSVRSRTFRESGFDGFLPKPIQRAKLIEILENLLGEKKALTEINKPLADTKPEPPGADPSADNPNPSDDSNSTPPAPLPHTESPRPTIRILVAEDNPINQKLAKFILTKAGHQVEVVDNGEQAVDIITLRSDQFDLIFMDVQMPKMSGIEACRVIRRNGFTSIPIIAMTAQAMKGDREKCLASGMNDYISKPIKREVVFDMVKKWAPKNL